LLWLQSAMRKESSHSLQRITHTQNRSLHLFFVLVLSKEFAKKHYHDLSERSFFNKLCDFLNSKEGVITYGRKLIGATDPQKSAPETIRGDLAVNVPDFLNAKIDGLLVIDVIRDHKWLEEEFTEKVQKFLQAKADRDMFGWQRGGVLIQKWGRSSAASTAVSIIDAIRSLITPTPKSDWFSTGTFVGVDR
ncbi:hypothetical protein HN873_064415, partial [Arachis hypogaea]